MCIRTPKTLCILLIILFFGGLIPLITPVSVLGAEVPAPLKTAQNDQFGTFLVGPKGMTLYIFDNDKEPGKSSCYGRCAENWPPFTPQPGDPEPVAPLSVITREDGSTQYAYKGKPLYYYVEDYTPGATAGHGVGNRWWVVKP